MELLAAINSENLRDVRTFAQEYEDEDFEDDEVPLHVAVEKGNSEILQVLLDSGFEVDRQSEDAFTPLEVACRIGNPEIVDVLIRAGADVVGENGYFTPLMNAVSEKHTPIVRRLLEEGVGNMMEMTDCDGDNVFGMLTSGDGMTIARMLLRTSLQPLANPLERHPAVNVADAGDTGMLVLFFSYGMGGVPTSAILEHLDDNATKVFLEAEKIHVAKWRSVIVCRELGLPGLVSDAVLRSLC